MKKQFLPIFITLAFFSSVIHAQESPQLAAVKTIIRAVNIKDPNLYMSVFDENAKVYVEGKLKIDGKQAFLENRSNHLKKYPKAKSEIQHLVEIDNKVIMHDLVWLYGEADVSQDIVEIFTFNKQGEIVKVEVIQPKDLFAGKKQ